MITNRLQLNLVQGRRALVLAVLGLASLPVLALGLQAEPASAAFPGANGKIAFASSREGNRDIYVMDADGSDQTRLTDHPGADNWPDWSPDGTKIAFDSFAEGERDIYVMNADGTGRRKLTNTAGGDSQPAWSPSGDKIAFVSRRDGDWDLYVMNADGSGQTNLTNDTSNDSAPAWSPDGSRIAFTSSPDFINADIHAINADGTGRRNLTNSPGFNSLAEWSPDGAKIAFHSDRDGNYEVYVMNSDGSGQSNLTDAPARSDASPAWSPDGTQIAFASGLEGDTEGGIYVMDADGGGVAALTNNEFFDDAPDWGPAADSDGDGVPDDKDAFPNDPAESADSDNDGLGDTGDPDTVGAAVEELPESGFAAPGHREAILSRLDNAEAAIVAGDIAGARRMLENLRRRLDGCEAGSAHDRDDWIVDCEQQDDVRALLDALLDKLD